MTAVLAAITATNTSSGTTVAVASPSSVASSDLILGYGATADLNGTTTITVDQSMATLSARADLAATGATAHVAAFHSNGVDESAGPTYTYTFGSATLSGIGMLFRVTNTLGADTTAGAVHNIYANAAAASSNAVPQITTSSNDCLVICIATVASGTTLTTPTAWTAWSGNPILTSHYVFYKIQAVAGLTGTATTTPNTTGDLFMCTFAALPRYGAPQAVNYPQAVNRASRY